MMSLKRKVVRTFCLLGASVMMMYVCLALMTTTSRQARDIRRVLTLKDFWGDPGEQELSLEPPDLGVNPEEPSVALGSSLAVGKPLEVEVSCGTHEDPSSSLGSNQELEENRKSVTRKKEQEEEEDEEEEDEAPPGALLVLLLSSMPRSGSTLLAEILSLQQESILFFEPLWRIQKDQCGNDSRCVAEQLSQIFNCSYEPSFENWLKGKTFFLKYFNAEAKRCVGASDKGARRSCIQNLNLRETCSASPVRVIKVIRARLSWVDQLLKNPQLNLKVVHLTRDPRASLASIAKFKGWNKKPYDRCVGLEHDLEAYDELSLEHPSRLLQVHHEDLCLDPKAVISGIYSFLYGDPRLPKAMEEYIETHMTKESTRSSMSTYKDSKKVFEAWRYKIPSGMLKDVEKEPTCLRSIQRMGHTVFNSVANARNSEIPLFLSGK